MNDWKEFPATTDNFYEMLEYVMAAADESGMSVKQQMRLEFGFEEAAANIINYAYGEGDGSIQIRTYADGEKFFVELKDNGEQFNPLEVDTNEDRGSTLEDAKVGGLGISFMRRIFDEMTYHYGNEGELFYNRLKLGMKLASA